MGTDVPTGLQGVLRSTREALAIVISIISFVISTVNVYVTNLKSPDLNLLVAPYIRQIVDDKSLNEAFFVPVTVVNQGAKPGTVLSFELVITHLPTGEQATFHAQYFAHPENPELLGSFFVPMNVAGYSSDGNTLCFYPLGEKNGNFFARAGTYQFSIAGVAANVKGRVQGSVSQMFHVELTQEMYDLMQRESDLEYRYPIPVEADGSGRTMGDILRSIVK